MKSVRVRDWATRDGEPRRGVILFPALLTVANMFLGYFAIVKGLQGEFVMGAALVLVAGITDKLDGLVARATNTASDFGRELDSLADLVTFGVAPAILSFAWALDTLGKWGWAVPFVFLACGGWRLGRFNVQAATTDPRFFVGLPIPMSAAVPMTLILAYAEYHPGQRELEAGPFALAYLGALIACAVLMVSRVRYFSFKHVRLSHRGRHPAVLLALVGVILAIAMWPGYALSVIAVAYASHGPVLRLLRRMPKAEEPDHALDQTMPRDVQTRRERAMEETVPRDEPPRKRE